jgi:hypothetical protein
MTSSVALTPRLPTLADTEVDRISRHCVYYYGLKVARGDVLSVLSLTRSRAEAACSILVLKVARRVVLSAKVPSTQLASVDIRLCAECRSCIKLSTHRKSIRAFLKSCYCISISQYRLLRILSSSHQPGSRAWKASASHRSWHSRLTSDTSGPPISIPKYPTKPPTSAYTKSVSHVS